MSQLPALLHREKLSGGDAEVSPTVRVQRMIFEQADRLDASDIHIEPGGGSTRVRYRVDGLLREVLELPRWMHASVVARIKVLSRLDISERRVPQDGHIQADAADGADIRVSILPTRWGEKVVIRMLRRGRSVRMLSQLGFLPAIEGRINALIRQPQGMVLVAGPTGSGKTTTLYGFINEIRSDPLNIVTIEDPIEYELDRITQVQVNEKAGLTFARALRSILRQDPDVILVGEIRDPETALTAFHAAMTGHLVFSTLHATDSVSAVLRLAELGAAPSVIASAINGIVAQRLLRLNCPACAESDTPYSIYCERLGISDGLHRRLRKSKGCPQCNASGIAGRCGVFELLELNPAIQEAIFSGSQPQIRIAARAAGLTSITEQAVRMVLDGTVAADEAYRTCYFGGA